MGPRVFNPPKVNLAVQWDQRGLREPRKESIRKRGIGRTIFGKRFFEDFGEILRP